MFKTHEDAIIRTHVIYFWNKIIQGIYKKKSAASKVYEESSHGVVACALDCNIVVTEFEF